MEMSGQPHAPAALTSGKGPPVPIGQEAGCAPEPVSTRSWPDLRHYPDIHSEGLSKTKRTVSQVSGRLEQEMGPTEYNAES